MPGFKARSAQIGFFQQVRFIINCNHILLKEKRGAVASSSGVGAWADEVWSSSLISRRIYWVFAARMGKELGSDQDSWQHAEAVQAGG